MVERGGLLGLVEPGDEIHHAGEGRQAAEPALAAAHHAEVDPGAEEVEAARVCLEQREGGLRQDERDVPLERVTEALALVADRIIAGAQVDEDVVAVHGDREAAQLVGELVEGAAGGQVEAGVVPVAREDPVADRPAVERKAHVRTPVVDRVYLLAFGEQAERVPVEVHDEAACGAELFERRSADATICCDSGHAVLLLHQKRGSSGSETASSSRLTPRYCSSVNDV